MQPTAASGRKFKMVAGRSKIPLEKKKLELPSRRVTLKREHNFAKIVKFNKPSAKKSGRTMSSTTTYPTRKEKVLSTVAAKTEKEIDE